MVVPINSSFHTTFVEAIWLEEKENFLISDLSKVLDVCLRLAR